MSWFRSFFAWFALWRSRNGVLLERNGGLGDLLCLLPSLAALKAQSPGRKWILITSRAFVPIMELAGILDAVIPADTRGLKWWRARLKAESIWLPDELKPPRPRSVIPLASEFARSLGLGATTVSQWRLEAPAAVRKSVRSLFSSGQKLVLIHPGPTWPVKEWPVEKWQELIQLLKQDPAIRVIQIGADAHDSQSQVSAPRIQGAEDWVGRLLLIEILALMAQSELFIGVDSGLLHLAASSGCKTMGLFGPTWAHCILSLSEQVQAVGAEVSCAGCHFHHPAPLHWRTGCPNEIHCMKTLSVEAVFRSCQKLRQGSKA